MYTSDL